MPGGMTMNDLTFAEYQLIIFLCFDRKNRVGLEEAEEEGTGDLYRKVSSIIRGYSEEKDE